MMEGKDGRITKMADRGHEEDGDGCEVENVGER